MFGDARTVYTAIRVGNRQIPYTVPRKPLASRHRMAMLLGNRLCAEARDTRPSLAISTRKASIGDPLVRRRVTRPT